MTQPTPFTDAHGLRFIAGCPVPEPVWERFHPTGPPSPDEMRAFAARLTAGMECRHLGAEHGDCSDCMNTGWTMTCQTDQDTVETARTLDRIANDLDRQHQPTPTAEDPF